MLGALGQGSSLSSGSTSAVALLCDFSWSLPLSGPPLSHLPKVRIDEDMRIVPDVCGALAWPTCLVLTGAQADARIPSCPGSSF